MESTLAATPDPPDYDQSRARLEAMGIPADLPREAVDYARKIAASCTDNDVRAMQGNLEYGKPMRFLRDQLKPMGWKVGRKQNLETVVSPDYSYAIVCSRGDQNTGDPTAMPTTHNEKGPRTEDAVKVTQMTLELPGLWEPHDVAAKPGAMQTWFLLYHRDASAKEIRLELSRGIGFTVLNTSTGHGVVSRFEPRLYIESISFAPETEIPGKDDLRHEQEHIDIDVVRRRAS